jgi:lauroyl/myristoyl acyltransferase
MTKPEGLPPSPPTQPIPQVPLPLRIERALGRAMFVAIRTLVRAVPYRFVRRLGAALGELQFRLGLVARRRMVSELEVLLGRPAHDRGVHEQMRTAYRTNNAAVLEILKLFDSPQDEQMLLAQVEIEGLATLRTALESGRGAILLAGHMGNGALMVIKLVASGIPVSVVYHQARMMDAGLFDRGLGAYGIRGILANDGIRAYGRMLSALRANEVVYMMADQGTKKAKDGLMSRFLGKDMPMPAGPAQLARHAKAPVLPVATVAAEPVWRFEILPPVPRDPTASLEQDVETLLKVSERLILDHPQFWSWHHRRWRHHPLAADVARPKD